MNGIERAPATRGDYTEWDDDGRELQVAVLSATVITYWTDEAVQDVLWSGLNRSRTINLSASTWGGETK